MKGVERHSYACLALTTVVSSVACLVRGGGRRGKGILDIANAESEDLR